MKLFDSELKVSPLYTKANPPQPLCRSMERLPMPISEQMLKSFYDLLISSNILTDTQAEIDYSERIKHLEQNDTIFTVTP